MLFAVAALVACIAGGCTPSASDAYLRAMYAGKRAYNAGRYDEAADSYARAARLATRVKDRDEAWFLEARMYQRLARPDQAIEAYRDLVRGSPQGPRTARAVFELGYLAIASGDPTLGWAQLRAAVVRYPNHGSARKALRLVVRHIAEQEGEAAARAFLQAQLARFDGTDADQQAEYEIARSLERSGLLTQARDAYVGTARAHPYPQGNLTDDAWWRAAKIEEKLGRYHQAVAHLQELVRPAEQDISGGRYERPRFARAQLRIAELYRDRLGDRAAARREYRRLVEQHGESLLVDDALWQVALLAHQDGAEEEACDVTAELRDSHPDSRYLRCVRELCPDAPRAAGARPCPPYLLREVRGEEPAPDTP